MVITLNILPGASFSENNSRWRLSPPNNELCTDLCPVKSMTRTAIDVVACLSQVTGGNHITKHGSNGRSWTDDKIVASRSTSAF